MLPSIAHLPASTGRFAGPRSILTRPNHFTIGRGERATEGSTKGSGMAETRPGLLRIWEAGESAAPIEPAPPPEHLDLARDLFQAEILRPLPRGHGPGAVMSLQWYLEAEQMRCQRQGHWL